MRFVHLKAVVVTSREASFFVFAFLNVARKLVWLTQFFVNVKPSVHQLQEVILALAHPVGNAVAGVNFGDAVRQDHIFSRNKHRYLTANTGVKVHLFKRRTGTWQVPQHLLVLRAVLRHLLGKLIVHVFLNTHRRFFFLGRFFADDLGTARSFSWEGLHDGVGLEAYYCFCNHRMEYSACAVPWLCAFLELEP